MTKEEAYAKLWGWEGGMLRLPLPAVPGIPVVLNRAVGNIGGVTNLNIPPYLVFHSESGALGLFRGDGWRATQHADAGRLSPHGASTLGMGDADLKLVERSWLFADSENLPEEWKQPIADAIAEIRERFPDVVLRYRP